MLINADNPVAEAFCKLRFDRAGYLFAASGAVIDTRSIIERSLPSILMQLSKNDQLSAIFQILFSIFLSAQQGETPASENVQVDLGDQ